MTPNAGRYAAGAAAGLAIALSLTACKGAGQDKASGDGKPASGGAQLTAAQTALAKVSTQADGLTSFRGTMSYAAGLNGKRYVMKAKVAYTLKPARAMRVDIPSLDSGGRKIKGLTEILDGDRLYLSMPGIEATTGKPWASVTVSQLTGGDDLVTIGEDDLSRNVKMLTASKDARSLGEETVAGVPTTHFQGTFDQRDGLAKLSGRQRGEAERSLRQSGLTKMNFDLWVDGQQRPRKISLVSPPGAKTSMKITTTYDAFNVPVTIMAPPKSQVADGSGLLGGRAGIPG